MSKSAAASMLDMGVDLGGLSAPATVEGTPLDIPLSDIQENPNNPRTEFELGALQELADDIKQSGVISPVSVFKSADGADKPYTLNYGARRLKASHMAKQATIPAFVTVELDAYQRVAENEQRAGLAPMELAEFIQDRISNYGETQTAIGKRLGKPKSVINEHLKLLELDGPVLAAFEAGQIAAARAAVDLQALISRATDSGVQTIKERLESAEPVTRSTVDKLKSEVKTKGPKSKSSSGRTSVKKVGKGRAKKIIQLLSTETIRQIEMLQPIIKVSVGRRRGQVAFNLKSRSDKNVWIRFDDMPNNAEQIKCTDMVINVVNYTPTTDPST